MAHEPPREERSQLDFDKAFAPVIDYDRMPRKKRVPTPEEERRVLAISAAVLLGITVAYWAGLFWRCRPALELFCLGPFMPWILTIAWGWAGWNLLAATRRHPPEKRHRLWIAAGIAALLLAPYSLIRADNDMFALGVRYRIWEAGGTEQVRADMSQWIATRPARPGPIETKWLFTDYAPDGTGSRTPRSTMPASVAHLRDHIPWRFGSVLDDVAYFDGVSFPNTGKVTFGPPGWEPKGRISLWNHICGGRRKIADGIWIDVGFYNK